MGVKIPGNHLRAQADLPELRKRLKGAGSRKSLIPELNLTAMIDMFSVIILFLVGSFSATGEILVANKDLTLPKASFAKQLERYPIVTVTKEVVILEGAGVGDNQGILDKIEERDWDLPLLTKKLLEYKTFFEGLHEGAKFPGEIILQADASLDFVYIKRVLYSLAKSGFLNVNLAVKGEPTGFYEKDSQEPAL